MARHVDGNDDEAAEGDGSDSESDGDGDMYDLGGETGGQVKKKKNQAPVAMARGGDDNDDDDDENMYDLGGETGGQIAQPHADEDEPLFSFVALNGEDNDGGHAPAKAPVAPRHVYETPVPAYSEPQYSLLNGQVCFLWHACTFLTLICSQADPQYDVANAPGGAHYEMIPEPEAGNRAGRVLPTQTSRGSVYGFEEAELKATGGEHDDKPDDYLELTADGLGKRKKSQK